jgi:hypothetical protein
MKNEEKGISTNAIVGIVVTVVVVAVVGGVAAVVLLQQGGPTTTTTTTTMTTHTTTMTTTTTPTTTTTHTTTTTTTKLGTTTTTTPSVTTTSLQFDVSSTAGGVSATYTLMAKNIGTSNLMMRIDGTFSGQAIIYIINGAQQKAWMYVSNTWMDLSASFSSYWGTWSQTFQGYQTDLSGWTGGTWTSPDGTVTISNIHINPSLADSLFAPPST